MAPSVIETVTQEVQNLTTNGKSETSAKTENPAKSTPLKYSGTLDKYENFEVTPVIGREYPKAKIAEWLRADNSDELLRDLAITISERGVVFFRAQDDLSNDLQKELIQRLGELAGKPKSSGLHIHPVANSERELGGKDNQISVISSEQNKKLYKNVFLNLQTRKQSSKDQWHSDITFEPVPADYTILRLTQLPKTGGDTLWASGYDVYDRLSKPYQQFLEGLTATYAQPRFNTAADENNFKLYTGERGSPDNVGDKLEAQHPVVRTNPMTGWKSIFAVGQHVQKINDLTDEESRKLLDWFIQLIQENHDLQARIKWQNPNDVAIWDNRSVYHAATPDYDGLGARTGQRAVGIGEKPYLDPNSKSRWQALGLTGGQNLTL